MDKDQLTDSEARLNSDGDYFLQLGLEAPTQEAFAERLIYYLRGHLTRLDHICSTEVDQAVLDRRARTAAAWIIAEIGAASRSIRHLDRLIGTWSPELKVESVHMIVLSLMKDHPTWNGGVERLRTALSSFEAAEGEKLQCQESGDERAVARFDAAQKLVAFLADCLGVLDPLGDTCDPSGDEFSHATLFHNHESSEPNRFQLQLCVRKSQESSVIAAVGQAPTQPWPYRTFDFETRAQAYDAHNRVADLVDWRHLTDADLRADEEAWEYGG